ncbi:MAG: hypothetical protein KDK34_02565 [Leptospiraceae bacterium]|nr:hypothetical protein [Leptospiraceae bacterium]
MSDPRLTYYGTVTKSGEIRLPKRMRRELIDAFRTDKEDRAIEVIVQRKRRRRSLPQNRYYWGVVIETLYRQFNEWSPTEWDREMIHTYLKERFLPKVWEMDRPALVVPDTGEQIVAPYTTTKLTTTLFASYIDAVSAWAWNDLGISIPAPEEMWGKYEITDINKTA